MSIKSKEYLNEFVNNVDEDEVNDIFKEILLNKFYNLKGENDEQTKINETDTK